MQSISRRNDVRIVIVIASLICAIMTLPIYGADRMADTSQNFKSRVDQYLAEADSAFRQDRYLAARKSYERALTEAKTLNDNSGATEALAMIARTYLIMNEPDSALTWLQQAGKIADKFEPRGWSRYQAVRGRYLWQDNQLDEATRLFKGLYDYCVKNKLAEPAVDAAHMVAITGSPQEQVEWGKKGIAQAEAGHIDRWLGPLWNNLGATYEDMQQYDSALAAYKKARDYHYQFGTPRNKVIADYAVGHILVKLGRFEEAGNWLRPVLTQCERAQDHEFVGLTCRDLGDIGYSSGNFGEALELYVRAKALLEEVDMDKWDPEGFRDLLNRIDETRTKME